MTPTLKETNALQVSAIMQCDCKDTCAFIMRNGATFRGIIEGYCAKFERLPTVDELIWCASEILEHNIRTER